MTKGCLYNVPRVVFGIFDISMMEVLKKDEKYGDYRRRAKVSVVQGCTKFLLAGNQKKFNMNRLRDYINTYVLYKPQVVGQNEI